MNRHEDWAKRLDHFMDAAQRRAFVWGEWDCCLMAANCIQELTGTDPVTQYRGAYTSKRGALKLILTHGGFEAFMNEIAADNACPKVPALSAQRGDAVLLPLPDMPALGICIGRHAAYAAPFGLTFVQIDTSMLCWRI